jgi:ribokinase
MDAVAAALRMAREENVRTILDPAPARALPGEVLAQVDFLTPNESEACVLLGRPADRVAAADASALAGRLLELGPKAVILKLGDQGSFYSDGRESIRCPAFPVQARDTTAAGDTFNGSFAVALAEGLGIAEALRFATAAAALSVTRLGAQTSIPSRAEIDEFLAASRG